MQAIVKGLFGDSVGQSLGSAAIAAFSWVHPLPLTLLWAHAIVYWSRIPAGEIESGTIDVLFSQPVSRLGFT